jgi:hypothetical protein
LPVEKMAKISAFAADLLTRKVCPICDVTRISGLIVSSFRAVLPSKLHCRALEHLKIASLEKKYNNHYDRSVVLTAEPVQIYIGGSLMLPMKTEFFSQLPCWCFNSK